MVPGSRPLMAFADTARPDDVTPRLIAAQPGGARRYERAMAAGVGRADRLLALGVPPEFALYVLPNAKVLRFVESGPLIALLHKWTMRTCLNAQDEIWLASMEEVEQVRAVHPRLTRFVGPPCVVRNGLVSPRCTEGTNFCGVPVWRDFPNVERRLVSTSRAGLPFPPLPRAIDVQLPRLRSARSRQQRRLRHLLRGGAFRLLARRARLHARRRLLVHHGARRSATSGRRRSRRGARRRAFASAASADRASPSTTRSCRTADGRLVADGSCVQVMFDYAAQQSHPGARRLPGRVNGFEQRTFPPTPRLPAARNSFRQSEASQ